MGVGGLDGWADEGSAGKFVGIDVHTYIYTPHPIYTYIHVITHAYIRNQSRMYAYIFLRTGADAGLVERRGELLDAQVLLPPAAGHVPVML